MPREGHKFSSWSIRSLSTHFNPRAPRGARPSASGLSLTRSTHFNPRAPRGARRFFTISRIVDGALFQSTCPARGTTCRPDGGERLRRISIHVPREGHDPTHGTGGAPYERISIHVPREGHDPDCDKFSVGGDKISIHVPREGHDATAAEAVGAMIYFNPRAPRGARPARQDLQIATAAISIHVPREGHDLTLMAILSSRLLFQSTCPARGTTAICKSFLAEAVRISIHVPREGHDSSSPQRYSMRLRISIHVPREGHDRPAGLRSCPA